MRFVAGRGAVTELLLAGALQRRAIGKQLLAWALRRDGSKRKSVRKNCRSAGDPAWKTMRQHREESAMAKVPGSYVKFWKRVYICSIRLIRE